MPDSIKIFVVTGLALLAFAANSIFCRLALQPSNIDPASFTSIRLISGALALIIILVIRPGSDSLNITKTLFTKQSWNWLGALLLFSYAILFSFVYTLLDTATGALILFATVQIFLLISQLVQGYRFSTVEIIGIILAMIGFIYLTLPGASRPDWLGLLLMSLAGISWGGYTLVGKHASHPTKNTAENFLRCVPITIIAWIIFSDQYSINAWGILWAVLSGVFASAMGYSLWYYSVKHINMTQAALSQLLVPVLAAIGGVLLVKESVTSSFIISAVLIVLGIAMVSLTKRKG